MTNAMKLKQITQDEIGDMLCNLASSSGDCEDCPFAEQCWAKHNGARAWLQEEFDGSQSIWNRNED